MGDQIDLPFDLCEEVDDQGGGEITQSRLIQWVKFKIDEEEEMQQSRVQYRSQPVEQLDRDIEEMRRLMLESTKKIVNKRWRFTIGDPTTSTTRKKQEKQRKGEGGQIQSEVWDPGGSNTTSMEEP
jgi:hypothetical protein